MPLQQGAEACIEAVYRHGGEARGQVIAVQDDPADASTLARLRGLQDDHPDLIVLCNQARVGLVASCNRGLVLRERDAVLLGEGAAPASGWLEELLEVLDSSDRIASVSSSAGGGSHPRATELRAAAGSCVLLRDWALHAIGCFDSALASLADAQDDWSVRARRIGLRHLRANRAAVIPARSASAAPAPLQICVDPGSTAPGAADNLVRRLRELPDLEVELLRDGLPLERFRVLYQQAPISGARHLAHVLDSPCQLVLGTGDPRNLGPESRALLFAAAQSAQAVVAGSEADRAQLISELLLDPAAVEVVPPSDARRLAAIFRRAVERPTEQSLRQRGLLAHFASWPAG